VLHAEAPSAGQVPCAGAVFAVPIPPAGPAPSDAAPFTALVRERFGRRAARYAELARLQRGVAWRLAYLCRDLPLPPGPCADLGAGTGLLSQALRQQRPNLRLSQLDLCPELLARNPLAENGDGALVWDLNRGLPPGLTPAALLASSFALQWLEDPAVALERWCAQLSPGGWLALAVPTAGSLNGWRQAAQAAAVPCTALPLPSARGLIAVAAAGLELRRCHTLRFTSSARDGRQALGRIGALGAGASRAPRLRPAQLRRLLDHWPQRPAWCWEVLLLLGRRR
jgi:malonyl-CoA O-methyltransferase